MTADTIPYCPEVFDGSEMLRRAQIFEAEMSARRSVRHFSRRGVPRELIEAAIRTASTAPSGANRQPWKFVAISNPELKRNIRSEVESEEHLSYTKRMSQEWRDALQPIGTDWRKPYLETVPWIVVVFEEVFAEDKQGRYKNYYVKESVGIACGLFITALHHMGLATLTHTPSPMGFLGRMLQRPANERAFILFPIGYPAADATVPNLRRKPLEDVATFLT
ncbi:MAG: nitroreductase family protein [Planctomycetota bacterium]|nr:nitroreductase family protein [Planctomycetota bacterium]